MAQRHLQLALRIGRASDRLRGSLHARCCLRASVTAACTAACTALPQAHRACKAVGNGAAQQRELARLRHTQLQHQLDTTWATTAASAADAKTNANANANTEAAVRRPRHHTRIGAARLDGEESAGRRPRAENAPARKKVPLDAGELRRRLELLWAARDE